MRCNEELCLDIGCCGRILKRSGLTLGCEWEVAGRGWGREGKKLGNSGVGGIIYSAQLQVKVRIQTQRDARYLFGNRSRSANQDAGMGREGRARVWVKEGRGPNSA